MKQANKDLPTLNEKSLISLDVDTSQKVSLKDSIHHGLNENSLLLEENENKFSFMHPSKDYWLNSIDHEKNLNQMESGEDKDFTLSQYFNMKNELENSSSKKIINRNTTTYTTQQLLQKE